jgi:hypothetical protein
MFAKPKPKNTRAEEKPYSPVTIRKLQGGEEARKRFEKKKKAKR